MLTHERLDVFRCSIDFLALLIRILTKMPKGNAILSDQLRRAGMSIPLNIAEGSGRSTDPDRKHFFLIARGSTTECAAILDVCRVINLVEAGDFEEAKALAERIVSMLTKMGR